MQKNLVFSSWRNIREKLQKNPEEYLTFNHGRSTIPSTYTVECCHRNFPMPVGIVWYNWVGNTTIMICYSFVHPRLRRLGIRTKIHEYLLQTWGYQLQKITTPSGTKESIPWLKKNKFVENKKSGDWELYVTHTH